MQLRYALPLLLFFLLVALFIVGMRIDPSRVPSPLIDKALPDFELAQLHDPERRINNQALLGEVVLLNVWASWCVSCRYEHPVLLEFSRSTGFPLVGLNYKDNREEAMAWLQRYGDPYRFSAFDPVGRTGIDFGVYGVPETYVLDRKGIVRYKHIGPLSQDDMDRIILPMLERLSSSPTPI